jgi:dihydrolipoamide dehydrogenase
MECDLVVVGSGPGGYPAAIRAAQLGASVIIVEEATLVGGESAVVGGTCLNVGCIPTKAMVQSAHAYDDAQGHFAQLGIRLGNVDLDFEQVQSNRRGIVDGVVKGLAGLLKGNGIQVVTGHGRFSGPNTLAVDGGEDIQFKSAVIATGSRPSAPPIPGIDHPRCIDSTGALELDAVPRRMLVLGGGVIGVEFASIYAQFGSAVTIIEMLPNLIGNEDADAVAALQRAFKRRGIAVELGAKATAVEERDGDLSLTYETGGEAKQLAADVVLVATGRVANVEDVGLEAAGVTAEPRRIPVDSHMRTNVPHIYAAGDVAGNWQLAHTAFREGEIAAENALGHASEIDYRSTPRCVYTSPEVASVGLSEAQAREQHDTVIVGTMPYAAIARAAMYGDRTGFVKVIGEARYGELLGMVAVGTQATELIEAGVVAIEAEATLETVGDSIAAHPTLGEATKEAALVALGRPLHIPAKR